MLCLAKLLYLQLTRAQFCLLCFPMPLPKHQRNRKAAANLGRGQAANCLYIVTSLSLAFNCFYGETSSLLDRSPHIRTYLTSSQAHLKEDAFSGKETTKAHIQLSCCPLTFEGFFDFIVCYLSVCPSSQVNRTDPPKREQQQQLKRSLMTGPRLPSVPIPFCPTPTPHSKDLRCNQNGTQTGGYSRATPPGSQSQTCKCGCGIPQFRQVGTTHRQGPGK